MQRFFLPYLFALGVSCWIVDAQASAGSFTVGGSVYTDLGEPLTSGLEGVTVCVSCDFGFNVCDITAGAWGGWDVSGVPADSCTVTLMLPGWCFSHVEGGEIGIPAPIAIAVDEAHQGQNLSLQFLGTQGTSFCCLVDADCDDGVACTLDECFEGVCADTPNDCPVDFDCDGVVGASDLALLLFNWGPCPECEADLNDDGEVGSFDLAILLGAWGPCP
ncbi:MAG: hypothetical protein O7D91_16780 [Planctomycetota bacterium]|nr:hypothetical protein [Planctomycetota bacterium]